MASGLGTSDVAGLAGRDQIGGIIVRLVPVNVVGGEVAWTKPLALRPGHWGSAPMAGMRAGADLRKQDLTVFESVGPVSGVDPHVSAGHCRAPALPARVAGPFRMTRLAGARAVPLHPQRDLRGVSPDELAAGFAGRLEPLGCFGDRDALRADAFTGQRAETDAGCDPAGPGSERGRARGADALKGWGSGTLRGHQGYLLVSRSGPVSAGAAPSHCTPFGRRSPTKSARNARGDC